MDYRYEDINTMLDSMKIPRERDIDNIKRILMNDGLLTQTKDILKMELHRLQREIETLEEVKTRCGFICEDDK